MADLSDLGHGKKERYQIFFDNIWQMLWALPIFLVFTNQLLKEAFFFIKTNWSILIFDFTKNSHAKTTCLEASQLEVTFFNAWF